MREKDIKKLVREAYTEAEPNDLWTRIEKDVKKDNLQNEKVISFEAASVQKTDKQIVVERNVRIAKADERRRNNKIRAYIAIAACLAICLLVGGVILINKDSNILSPGNKGDDNYEIATPAVITAIPEQTGDDIQSEITTMPEQTGDDIQSTTTPEQTGNDISDDGNTDVVSGLPENYDKIPIHLAGMQVDYRFSKTSWYEEDSTGSVQLVSAKPDVPFSEMLQSGERPSFVELGEEITMDFSETELPDKITVSTKIYTADGVEKWVNFNDGTEYIPSETDNPDAVISIAIEPEARIMLSSNSSDYEQDYYTGYIITCTWDEKSAVYMFMVRKPWNWGVTWATIVETEPLCVKIDSINDSEMTTDFGICPLNIDDAEIIFFGSSNEFEIGRKVAIYCRNFSFEAEDEIIATCVKVFD